MQYGPTEEAYLYETWSARGRAPHIHNLDNSKWLASRFRRCTPAKIASGTHWIGGSGSRAGVDAAKREISEEHGLPGCVT
jgi:hypothetical protein